MGPRNLLILFFSTVAVSLVILIIFFSLFFKNVDINFNTKLPESAPDLGKIYGGGDFKMDPNSKADGIIRSTVNVPPETHGPIGGSGGNGASKPVPDSDLSPSDADLPPISDDVMLQDDSLPPLPGDDTPSTPPTQRTAHSDHPPAPAPRPAERKPARLPDPRPSEPMQPLQPLQPINESEPSSGPPVPGQG